MLLCRRATSFALCLSTILYAGCSLFDREQATERATMRFLNLSMSRDYDEAERLLNREPGISRWHFGAHDLSALHFIAGNLDDPRPVHLLLDAGANVNDQDMREWTPLDYAVDACNLKVATALVSEGGRLGSESETIDPKGFIDFIHTVQDAQMLTNISSASRQQMLSAYISNNVPEVEISTTVP